MTTALIITMRKSMLIFITFKLTTFKKKIKTTVLRVLLWKAFILPYSLTEEKVHS